MPGRHEINVQDGFLFQSLKESRPLDVTLASGKRYEGAKLKRFDRFAIIVEAGGQERLIYKHAIEEIGDVAGAATRSANWAGDRTRRTSSTGDRRPRTAHWG